MLVAVHESMVTNLQKASSREVTSQVRRLTRPEARHRSDKAILGRLPFSTIACAEADKAAAVSFRAWFGVALAGGPIKRLPDEHGADFCGVPVEDRGARVRVWVR